MSPTLLPYSRNLLNVNQSDLHQFTDVHLHLMTVIWLALANLGLWSNAFKQYKWSKLVHGFCMAVLILLTFLNGIFGAVFIAGTDQSD